MKWFKRASGKSSSEESSKPAPTPASGMEPTPAAGMEPTPAAGMEPTPAAGMEPTPAAGMEPTPAVAIELENPGLSEDHPKQIYFEKMMNSTHIAWYTSDASSDQLFAHLVEGLQLQSGDVAYMTSDGFGCHEDLSVWTRNDSFRFNAISGPRGVVVSVWPLGDSWVAQINSFIEGVGVAMMEQLSRGEFSGLPLGARYVLIDNGVAKARDGYLGGEGEEFFAIVNAGDVVPVKRWE